MAKRRLAVLGTRRASYDTRLRRASVAPALARLRERLLEVVNQQREEDPEIDRLGRFRSPWQLIQDCLVDGTARAPSSVLGAQRLMGEGVEVSAAESKPRDSSKRPWEDPDEEGFLSAVSTAIQQPDRKE